MPDQIAAPLKLRRQPFKSTEIAPLVVRIAFWLVLASLLIGVCLTVGRIAGFDWATYVAQSHAKEDSENRPRLSDGFLLYGLIVSWCVPIVRVALWLIVARYLRRGYQWARVFLTAATAVGLATSFIGGITPFLLVTALLDVATAALVWTPPANQFFALISAARRSHRNRQLT